MNINFKTHPFFSSSISHLSWLREWELWALLLIAITLWSIAYQTPYTYQLDIGGSKETQRRWDDEPYLRAFHAPEPASLKDEACSQRLVHSTTCEWWGLEPEPYRWTMQDSSIHFPGLGGGYWLVVIRAGGQPVASPITSRWSDGTHTTIVPLPNSPRTYRLLARSDLSGDLRLHFMTPLFAPTDDPRPLGFRLYNVTLAAVAGLYMPAVHQMLFLTVSLLLLLGLMRYLCFPIRMVLRAGALLILLTTYLLTSHRIGFGVFAPYLLAITVCCYLLGLILQPLLLLGHNENEIVKRRGQLLKGKAALLSHRLATGLVLLAFAIRLGGLIHPHTRDSDIGLNANNLTSLLLYEGAYMTEGLPSDTGGGVSPYPPGQYITLAPMLLVFPFDMAGRKLLLKVGNALMDSLILVGIWYVLRRVCLGTRAALFGMALYILPLPILRSLSVGELANVSGQALAFPALAMLGIAASRLRERAIFFVMLALLTLAFLGHTGVSISLLLVLGILGFIWLFTRSLRPSVGLFLLLCGTALCLVALFYYSFFLYLIDFSASNAEASPITASNFIKNVDNELQRTFAREEVSTLLASFLGIIGIGIFQSRKQHDPIAPSLTALLLACWGGAILSFGPLLLHTQTVRWFSFLYPVLCLSAGPTLAFLTRRGRAGLLIVATILGLLWWQAGVLWLTQLVNYLHD